MATKLHQYLPTLTVVALLAGLLVGLLLQGKTHTSRPLDEGEFLHELDRGAHMPVIITGPELDHYVLNVTQVAALASTARTLKIESGQIVIPDAYSASFFNCARSGGHAFFKGDVQNKYQVFKVSNGNIGADSEEFAARFQAVGTVFTCYGSSSRAVVASGVSISAPIHQGQRNVITIVKQTAWASFSGFAANLYLTFLLMLFLPTLALSLVKSIVESATSSKQFRFAIMYFAISTLIAAAVGSTAALAFGRLSGFQLTSARLQAVAQCIGGHTIPTEYDANPVLTQLARIIPTNPLGALTDPSGNSGLQVAFIAVIVGMSLATLGTVPRSKVSEKLRLVLGIVISGKDLKCRAISEYADLLAPVGVFFLALTTFSTMEYGLLHDLAVLSMIICAALGCYVALLLCWLVTRRSFGDWIRRGFIPSFGGLITAFATASSYAALPAITAVPLLETSTSKRGIFDIGTTLNKNGTAVYLAAAATFLYMYFGPSGWHVVVPMILMASLAGTVVAGLPFAAVFGLQMILSAFGIPAALAWLILPIDPLADRLVTAVNVFSNLAACSEPKRQEVPSILVPEPATSGVS